MNHSLRWKLALAFALVFVAGATCGFFGSFHLHRLFFHPHHGELAEHMKRNLRAQLNLTSEQIQQLAPIIDRGAAQLDAQRKATHKDVRAIFEQTHREMLPFLSPEQKTKLETLEKRHRQSMHHRGFGPPPAPPEDHG